jgi:hypothetical protein
MEFIMHKENFIVTVKNGGKTLREREGKVFLPYGSEYSIRLTNLRSVKATTTVTCSTVEGSSSAARWHTDGRLPI